MLYIVGMEVVTNAVAVYRQKRGETQEALAAAVEVSRQTIIAIERGNYSPSVALAIRLAGHFRVTVETLFTLARNEIAIR
jgi:putative transcriptional regulator